MRIVAVGPEGYLAHAEPVGHVRLLRRAGAWTAWRWCGTGDPLDHHGALETPPIAPWVALDEFRTLDELRRWLRLQMVPA